MIHSHRVDTIEKATKMEEKKDIKIITDSASDIVDPQRSDLIVLPMTITFNGVEYQDGINLSHREFYEKLIESDELPTTSQIAPYAFEEAIRKVTEAGGIDFDMPYFLGYTCLSDALLQKYISDSKDIWMEHVESLPVFTVGGTIRTHVGPGAIALAFFALH